jgi:hypothetical protein
LCLACPKQLKPRGLKEVVHERYCLSTFLDKTYTLALLSLTVSITPGKVLMLFIKPYINV